MCGLVGWAATGAGIADPDLLAAAAQEAAERGPHSHGWAWWDGESWVRQVGRGPLTPPPPEARRARAIVGHSRLATSGSAPGDEPPTEEAQPYVNGVICVAHNGTVADPDLLAKGAPVTVDSEAILAALGYGWRLDEVVGALGPAPQALLVGHEGKLWAVRRDGVTAPAHPLWELRTPVGSYLSSRPFDAGCTMLEPGERRVAA